MALFIGLMSGTSADAIDVALVDFASDPLTVQATLSYPWPDALRQQVLHLSQQHPQHSTLHELAQLDIQAGELFAQAVLTLLAQTGLRPEQIQAIGSPGQTIYHHPVGNFPYTWQIGDANRIAQRTGIPTVADFRRGDMAAGGQGAPLAPVCHQAFWRTASEMRVVVNIGGIANITVLPADKTLPVIGFDTGPGNALLDAYAQQYYQQAMDKDGLWARQGQVVTPLLKAMRADDYFAQPPPKTTGRDYFNLDWLQQFSLSAQPGAIQATLAQLTIETIAQAALAYAPQRLLVCGGGVHNSVIMEGLQQHMPHCIVESTQTYGVAPDWVEAVCFAWLAKQRIAQRPSNLPSVTGAKHAVILGSVYI